MEVGWCDVSGRETAMPVRSIQWSAQANWGARQVVRPAPPIQDGTGRPRLRRLLNARLARPAENRTRRSGGPAGLR